MPVFRPVVLIENSVDIVWENSRGDVKKTQAKCGMNLMRVAHAHGIELEGKPTCFALLTSTTSWVEYKAGKIDILYCSYDPAAF